VQQETCNEDMHLSQEQQTDCYGCCYTCCGRGSLASTGSAAALNSGTAA
jgi:hypothetical protein